MRTEDEGISKRGCSDPMYCTSGQSTPAEEESLDDELKSQGKKVDATPSISCDADPNCIYLSQSDLNFLSNYFTAIAVLHTLNGVVFSAIASALAIPNPVGAGFALIVVGESAYEAVEASQLSSYFSTLAQKTSSDIPIKLYKDETLLSTGIYTDNENKGSIIGVSGVFNRLVIELSFFLD